MEDFENQMDCVIVEAFPKFDLEDLQEWSMSKTMYYYTRAEWILSAIRGVPISIEGLDSTIDSQLSEAESEEEIG